MGAADTPLHAGDRRRVPGRFQDSGNELFVNQARRR